MKQDQSRVLVFILASALAWVGADAAESAEKKAATTVVNLSTTVSGNQDQPKVLYIVPWKTPEVAAATRQNLQSQLLSVFSHVDRQALQRELKQYPTLADSDDGTGESAGVE